MTNAKLRAVVAEAVSLDREKSDIEARLKDIKALLVAEAQGRAEEHTQTVGGGSSWIAEGNDGCIARVTFPSPKLASSIKGVGKKIAQVMELAGKSFARLFSQEPSWKPVDDFREAAVEELGQKDGRKLVKLLEGPSTTSVSFETKEAAQ